MTVERIDSVINALPVPVIVIGADERVRAANDAVGVILGPNLTGRHYITALRQPAVIDAVVEARKLGGTRQTRYTGRDGAKDTSYRVVVAMAGDDT